MEWIHCRISFCTVTDPSPHLNNWYFSWSGDNNPNMEKREIGKFWEKFCLQIKFDIDNCADRKRGVRREPRGALVSMSPKTNFPHCHLQFIFWCQCHQRANFWCDIDNRKYIEKQICFVNFQFFQSSLSPKCQCHEDYSFLKFFANHWRCWKERT